jgi:hypothetical protein
VASGAALTRPGEDWDTRDRNWDTRNRDNRDRDRDTRDRNTRGREGVRGRCRGAGGGRMSLVTGIRFKTSNRCREWLGSNRGLNLKLCLHMQPV